MPCGILKLCQMPKTQADRALKVLMLVTFAAFLFTISDVFHERIVQAGERAPSFRLQTDSGRTITPSEFGGKLLVLNFWATWCPPCVEEFPSLDAFARQMTDSGVVVLGVSVDKNEAAYKNFLRQAQPGFLTARDSDANISSDYGTFRWPETYVINREGRVVRKYIGPETWTDPRIVNDIKSLL